MCIDAEIMPRNTDQSAMSRLLDDFGGAMISTLIYLGDRNGLFASMAGEGPMTVDSLALKTGQSARYLSEWLAAMACAGYVEYNATSATFALPPNVGSCFVDPDSPVHLGGLFEMLPTLVGNVDKVAKAFAWGTGVPLEEYGEEFRHGYERFAHGQMVNRLVPAWIAALDGMDARLRRGARVAQIGCGNGQALLVLARAYPESTFVGYDVRPPVLEAARVRVKEAGLLADSGDSRVQFQALEVEEGMPEQYDLICAFNVIHRMVDPVGALMAVRRSLQPDGALLWTEFNVSADLADNLDDTFGLARLAYSTSTLYGMTTSLAEGGAGIGTCLGHAGAERLARLAGLSHFRLLPVEDRFALVFEARP